MCAEPAYAHDDNQPLKFGDVVVNVEEVIEACEKKWGICGAANVFQRAYLLYYGRDPMQVCDCLREFNGHVRRYKDSKAKWLPFYVLRLHFNPEPPTCNF